MQISQSRISSYVLHSPFPCRGLSLTGQTAWSGWESPSKPACGRQVPLPPCGINSGETFGSCKWLAFYTLLNLPFNANLTIKNQLLRSAFPFPLWGKGLGDRGFSSLTGQTARSGWESPSKSPQRGDFWVVQMIGILHFIVLPYNANFTIKNQLLRFAFPFPLWGKGSGDRGLIELTL